MGKTLPGRVRGRKKSERNSPASLEEVLQAQNLLVTRHPANIGLNIVGMPEALDTRSLQTLQWVSEGESHRKVL